MSVLVVHNTHELHQLKKLLAPPPGKYDCQSALSFYLNQQNNEFFCCASLLREAGALLSIFRKSSRSISVADPRLRSVHPSTARESKWRYIMKKVNLRELYPDVYKPITL